MSGKRKSVVPALLVGLAAVVEAAVALITVSQFDMILAIGLFVGALVLWTQARKSAP